MKILFFLIIVLNLKATEIIYTHQEVPTLPLKIIKTYPQSEYLAPTAKYNFELIGSNGSTYRMVCTEKDPENKKKLSSYLIYSNIAHIEVKKFKLSDHQLCEDMAVYLEAVFEFIDEENPIYIELDLKKFVINKIVLPPLNPYMDRLPKKITPRLDLLLGLRK